MAVSSEPTIAVVRNEIDPDRTYHCDAIAGALESTPVTVHELDYPAGERPDLESVDGLVLSGSTVGVYDAPEEPWIDDETSLVETVIEQRLPTLGICFGHQLVNVALGGTVEARESTCRPVDAELDDEPLFSGCSSVVPAVHGDYVTAVGEDLEVVASTDYYPAYATRHREAPLWTVQFHPELTEAHRERLVADFGWPPDRGFEEITATRVLDNFVSLVSRRS